MTIYLHQIALLTIYICTYTVLQPLMNDVKAKTGADLENLVYFKDDSHYFVMTVRKHSLLQTGVLKQVSGTYILDIALLKEMYIDKSTVMKLKNPVKHVIAYNYIHEVTLLKEMYIDLA